MIRVGDFSNATQILHGYKDFRLEETKAGLRIASEALTNTSKSVDASWLPLCAETYCISANLDDYVIADVPIVHVDIPNRNCDAFPYDEMIRWDHEVGRVVYQSFIGKPTHKDHDNKDPRKAKGVIFDASLEKVARLNKPDLFVIRILAGYDRTKDPSLCEDIASGKRPGHSMGAMVGYTKCAMPGCNATSTTGKINCPHMQGSANKGKVMDGHLLYERCYSVRFIENSSVGDAANFFATQGWVK